MSAFRYMTVIFIRADGKKNLGKAIQFLLTDPLNPSGHYMYRQWSLHVPPLVTTCTASCHYMYRQWSLYVPPVVTICTASGHYMYRQFNVQQFYVLPTQCIYVFCVDLRTNSDYFPIQH